MLEIVRVKKLVDGKAIGKSFRVYKYTEWENGNVTICKYYPLKPNAYIDKLELDLKVTEQFKRMAPKPPKVKLITVSIGPFVYQKHEYADGYVRKSSACPKTEASTPNGKLKSKIKQLQRIKSKTPTEIEKIKELRRILRNYQKPTPKKSVRRTKLDYLLSYFSMSNRQRNHPKLLKALADARKEEKAKRRRSKSKPQR